MLLLAGRPGLLEGSPDLRSGKRRKLRLEAFGYTAADESAKVLIHDLSQTGILIETEAQLSAGEAIQVELPHGEAREAKVVWSSDGLFGCQFERPISKAAVSAALLKAPVDGSEIEDAEYPCVHPQTQGSGRADEDTERLSPRTRVVVIVALALLMWAPVAAVLALLVF
jgi:hypothetical protein